MEKELFSYETEVGSRPAFKWVNVENLFIPHGDYKKGQYQRDLDHITSGWDWGLCGALKVSDRGENKYAVIDGGNRTRAARRLKIKQLPCMVYHFDSVESEAKVFTRTATSTKSLQAVDKHAGAYASGDPMAMDVESIVSDAGYKIGPSNCRHNFCAIATLYKMVKKDPKVARDSFYLCSDIAGGDTIPNQVLSGIFTLEMAFKQQSVKESVFSEANRSKLIMSSMSGVMAKVNKAIWESPNQKGCNSVYAKAVLEIVNKNRRYKIKVQL